MTVTNDHPETIDLTSVPDRDLDYLKRHGDAALVARAQAEQDRRAALPPAPEVPEIAVGDGVTMRFYAYGGDCYPGTVIHVTASGKTVKVQEDKATITDGSAHDGSAEYEYEPDPTGRVRTFRWSAKRKGFYDTAAGMGITQGRRRYHDPHL